MSEPEPTPTKPLPAQLLAEGRLGPDCYSSVLCIWRPEKKEEQVNWLVEQLDARIPENQTAATCFGVFIGPPGVDVTKVSTGAAFKPETSHLALSTGYREDFFTVIDYFKEKGFSIVISDLQSAERVFCLLFSEDRGFAIHLAWRSLECVPIDPLEPSLAEAFRWAAVQGVDDHPVPPDEEDEEGQP